MVLFRTNKQKEIIRGLEKKEEDIKLYLSDYNIYKDIVLPLQTRTRNILGLIAVVTKNSFNSSDVET